MSFTSTAQHYVPWDGNIELRISSARAKSLFVKETDDVTRNFQAQILKLTDAGVDFTNAQPAISGLILSCDNPQAAYDAIFGASATQSAKVIAFPKKQLSTDVPSKLHAAFENAVDRFRLGENFAMAARAPVANNGPAFTPALQAA